MVPALPAANVRAAIGAGDWAQATALLAEHQRVLVSALSKTDLARESVAPWRELLLEQRALQDELRAARDEAGRELDKLGRGHRGARAWLRELA